MKYINDLTFTSLKLIRKIFRKSGIHRLDFFVWIYKKIMMRLTQGSIDYFVDFRGMNLAMEPGDVTLLPSVISGDFEEIELDWFENWLKKEASKNLATFVIDVGANVGIYSVLATKYLSPESLILAFEPDQRNIRRLERNLKFNSGIAQSQVIPKAVSSYEGTVSFSVALFGGTNHIAMNNDKNVIEVPCTTLNQIAEEYIAEKFAKVLIKIDVEGFEPQVISGGVDFIRGARPTLLLEISRDRLGIEFGNNQHMIDTLFEIYGKSTVISGNKIEPVIQRDYMQVLKKHHLASLMFDAK